MTKHELYRIVNLTSEAFNKIITLNNVLEVPNDEYIEDISNAIKTDSNSKLVTCFIFIETNDDIINVHDIKQLVQLQIPILIICDTAENPRFKKSYVLDEIELPKQHSKSATRAFFDTAGRVLDHSLNNPMEFKKLLKALFFPKGYDHGDDEKKIILQFQVDLKRYLEIMLNWNKIDMDGSVLTSVMNRFYSRIKTAQINNITTTLKLINVEIDNLLGSYDPNVHVNIKIPVVTLRESRKKANIMTLESEEAKPSDSKQQGDQSTSIKNRDILSIQKEVELNRLMDPLSKFIRCACGSIGFEMSKAFTDVPSPVGNLKKEVQRNTYLACLSTPMYMAFEDCNTWISGFSNKKMTIQDIIVEDSPLFICSARLCGHLLRKQMFDNPLRGVPTRYVSEDRMTVMNHILEELKQLILHHSSVKKSLKIY